MLWHTCSIRDRYEMKVSECLSNRQIQIAFQMNKDYFQYRNGTIILSHQFIDNHPKFGLLCTLQHDPNTLLSQYMIDLSSVRTSNTKDIFEILTPLYTDVYVHQGSVPHNQYKLLAGYRARKDLDVTYQWTKDGFAIDSNFERNGNELFFPDEIEIRHHGIYKLTVSTTESGKSIYFTFNVIVIGTPTLKFGVNSTFHIFKFPGEDFNLTAEFEGFDINLILLINDVEMNFQTQSLKRQSIDRLKAKYNYFSNMSFEMNKSVGTYFTAVQYQTTNLRVLDLQKKEKHLVNITATNPAGKVQLSGVIEVLDPPKWKILSVISLGHNKTQYQCEIFEDVFIRLGIRIEYAWIVNDRPISEIGILNASYMVNRTKLILYSFSDSKTFNITCEVTLLETVIYSMRHIFSRNNTQADSPFTSNVLIIILIFVAVIIIIIVLIFIYFKPLSVMTKLWKKHESGPNTPNTSNPRYSDISTNADSIGSPTCAIRHA